MSAKLVFFSDFVCPFCFVAERGVLQKLVAELDLDLEWSGFQLHPRTPKGGQALSSLFPAAKLPAMRENMKKFSQGFGVTLIQGDHLPNTRRPLAVAEYARSQGRLHPFRSAVMDAHWLAERDIETDDVIGDCAVTAGLDRASAIASADDPQWLAKVDAQGAEARKWGVSGVPTYFILPDGWKPGDPPPADGRKPAKIVGCQSEDLVRNACRVAGVQPRQ